LDMNGARCEQPTQKDKSLLVCVEMAACLRKIQDLLIFKSLHKKKNEAAFVAVHFCLKTLCN